MKGGTSVLARLLAGVAGLPRIRPASRIAVPTASSPKRGCEKPGSCIGEVLGIASKRSTTGTAGGT